MLKNSKILNPATHGNAQNFHSKTLASIYVQVVGRFFEKNWNVWALQCFDVFREVEVGNVGFLSITVFRGLNLTKRGNAQKKSKFPTVNSSRNLSTTVFRGLTSQNTVMLNKFQDLHPWNSRSTAMPKIILKIKFFGESGHGLAMAWPWMQEFWSCL